MEKGKGTVAAGGPARATSKACDGAKHLTAGFGTHRFGGHAHRVPYQGIGQPKDHTSQGCGSRSGKDPTP